MLAYRGPIHLPTKDGLDDSSVKANLTYQVDLVSSAGSVISGAITNADVTACTDFASFASVFQEYRVLGFTVKYVNWYNGTYNATVTPRSGAMCTSHVSTIAAPASVDAVVQVADHKTWRTAGPLSVTWRARGTEEMAFTATTATSTHGGVQYYCTAANANVGYGTAYITFTVEYRSRK